ncbi:MAG: sialate O-acetylesterase, partial [Bacteroidaceae bacterium]|nr:sialate O-acetylesterase [Bacteroidaceae bacterium]
GERLGKLALSQTYDCKKIVAHGPTVEKATRKGCKVTLNFGDNTVLSTSDNQPLRTITIAGEIGVFYPADKVEIKGNKIVVSSKKVEKPARVRYGWEAYSTGNLVNQFALPASTFEVVVK